MKLLCWVKQLPTFTLQAQRLKCLCAIRFWGPSGIECAQPFVLISDYSEIFIEGNSARRELCHCPGIIPLLSSSFWNQEPFPVLGRLSRNTRKWGIIRDTFTCRWKLLTTCAQYVQSFARCFIWLLSQLALQLASRPPCSNRQPESWPRYCWLLFSSE